MYLNGEASFGLDRKIEKEQLMFSVKTLLLKLSLMPSNWSKEKRVASERKLKKEAKSKKRKNVERCTRLGSEKPKWRGKVGDGLGGSPGLVVMGGGSRTEGCGFGSRRHILDGQTFFHIDLL